MHRTHRTSSLTLFTLAFFAAACGATGIPGAPGDGPGGAGPGGAASGAVNLPAVEGRVLALDWRTDLRQASVVVIAGAPGGGALHLGVVDPSAGRYTTLATLPRAQRTPFAAAVGGEPAARRIFVAWVAPELSRLMLAVLDASGRVVAPPRALGEASPLDPSVAAHARGAVIAHAHASDGPARGYQPFVTRVDLDGAVLARERVDELGRGLQGVAVAADPEGAFAVAYATNEGALRLRRHSPSGAPREEPLTVATRIGWSPAPFLRAVSHEGSTLGRLYVGAPVSGTPGDLDLSSTSWSGSDALTMVGRVSVRAPSFARSEAPRDLEESLHAVSIDEGGALLALWVRIVERQPDYLGCALPPPTRVEARLSRALPGREGRAELPALYEWRMSAERREPPSHFGFVTHAGAAAVTSWWLDGATLRYERRDLR